MKKLFTKNNIFGYFSGVNWFALILAFVVLWVILKVAFDYSEYSIQSAEKASYIEANVQNKLKMMADAEISVKAFMQADGKWYVRKDSVINYLNKEEADSTYENYMTLSDFSEHSNFILVAEGFSNDYNKTVYLVPKHYESSIVDLRDEFMSRYKATKRVKTPYLAVTVVSLILFAGIAFEESRMIKQVSIERI